MTPLPCRILIAIAACIVPRSKRSEWKREWDAELWHKAQAGTGLSELLRCAWGAFRDAAWLLESERKRRGFDLFRKPLCTELAFLIAALLLAGFSGALNAPKLPFTNAGRLIAVTYPMRFPGASDSMFERKYVALARLESQTLEDIVLYRTEHGGNPRLFVTRNFLSVLGAKPLLGRTFNEADPDTAAILSERFWRERYRADPGIVGAAVTLDGTRYRVIGVMPRQFWFVSEKMRYYAALERSPQPVGMVGLLTPRETVHSAQAELRRIAGEVESPWIADGLEAQPILQDPRPQALAFGAGVAFAGALLGIAFLAWKRLGGGRYWLFLGARIGAVLLGFGFLRMWALSLGTGHGPGRYSAFSLFSVWIFPLLCFAAMCLLIIDHRARCLMCFARLRMPAPIGVWSSQILDQPVTEYMCPAGHGALVVAGTGNAPDHWMVLDETWQDLFAHTEE